MEFVTASVAAERAFEKSLEVSDKGSVATVNLLLLKVSL